VDLAYFVGGESLITDEHYVILEEMIRRGRTDITLRYNTNASHVSHKRHDILALWKHFRKIELSCSIDHYGDRAEWLRHGTDWAQVEKNLKMFRGIEHVDFQLNTVFSIFNYLTLDDFYTYLREHGIVRTGDWYHSLYQAVNPSYYCAQSLPSDLKAEARRRVEKAQLTHGDHPLLVQLYGNAISFASQQDSWAANSAKFRELTSKLDKLRGEQFANVFPELTSLTEDVYYD
jgi:sulfatase maturation enzyme AslB (radical SAM superfamily)